MEGGDLKPFIELNGHSAVFSSENGPADLDVCAGATPAFESLEIEQQIDIDAGPFSQGFYGMEEGAVGTYICGQKIQTPVISILANHFDRGGGSNTEPLESSLLFHRLVDLLTSWKLS
jgi:hypothetical protein